MSKPHRSLACIAPDPFWFREQYYATVDLLIKRADVPVVRSLRESRPVLNKLCAVLGRAEHRYREVRQWEAILCLCRYPRLLVQAGWDARVVSAWVDVQLSGLTAHERLRLAAASRRRREPETLAAARAHL